MAGERRRYSSATALTCNRDGRYTQTECGCAVLGESTNSGVVSIGLVQDFNPRWDVALNT